MLKKILIVVGAIAAIIAVIILVLVVVVAMQPAEFSIVRSATLSAPPGAVFEQVNDFHNWTAWSPWEKLDPALKRTYAGPAAGTGTIYSWSGNKQAGEGRMTLTESRPGELIRIKLEFFKPFAATNTAEFLFQPEGQQTVVTWSMTGQHNFFSKAFCMFMNMDKIVGGDFEKGLAALKSIAETASQQ